MHNLMMVNSWWYFTGLNKCRMIGEENIQDMVASSEVIDCVKKSIAFNKAQYITQNSWVIVA